MAEFKRFIHVMVETIANAELLLGKFTKVFPNKSATGYVNGTIRRKGNALINGFAVIGILPIQIQRGIGANIPSDGGRHHHPFAIHKIAKNCRNCRR